MKMNFTLIGIMVVVILTVIILFYTQQPQKSSGEFYPGTGCEVDADCKYITYETTTGSKNSLCANPIEFSKSWNVSITTDSSVECFCDLQEGTGGAPLYVCAEKYPIVEEPPTGEPHIEPEEPIE